MNTEKLRNTIASGFGFLAFAGRTSLKLFLIVIVTALSYSVALAAELPSFDVPTIPGCGEKIKALADVAGPDWREVAEKNRTTGLEKLSWGPLKDALVEKMQKYADKETGDVGGEPIDEVGEIAEAALRSENFAYPYGIALWRHFFMYGKPVRDKVTAAKLLNGFERSLPGIVPIDDKGEKVEFSPRWLLTHCKWGTYKTMLPDGGYFESSWTNSSQKLVFDIKTSAKTLECHVRPAYVFGFRKVTVNGKDVDFGRSMRGCNFVANPDDSGVVHMELFNSFSWPKGK